MKIEIGSKYMQTHKRSGNFVVVAVGRRKFGATWFIEMEHKNGVRYFTSEQLFFKSLTPVK